MTACESLGLRNQLAEDQVPDQVKAAPLLVERAPPLSDDTPWPRVGDVPFKPNDFSPKIVYNHYMNELEFQRAEAATEKSQAAQEDVVLKQEELPDTVAPQNGLAPPQLPPPSKE